MTPMTAIQTEALRLLASGWFICRQKGPFAKRSWIQRGKPGGSGERRKLHGGTFWALLDRNAIWLDDPTLRIDVWRISARGKIALGFGLRARKK